LVEADSQDQFFFAEAVGLEAAEEVLEKQEELAKRRGPRCRAVGAGEGS
jgi:hypothetical protein